MTKNTPLGYCTDRQPVYLDLENSHVPFHLLETPNLLGLVRNALPSITPTGEQTVAEYTFEHNVGVTTLVDTYPGDEIVYALRIGRTTLSRFVKGKQPLPTPYIVVVLRHLNGRLMLWTAMCGRILPPTAYDPDSRFSQTHALVYDESLIQLNSIQR